MISSLTFAALFLAGPAPNSDGGVYFEQTTVPYSAGKPSGPGVAARVWCSGKRMRLEAGEGQGGAAFILRLDEGAAYRIEPQEIESVLGTLAGVGETAVVVRSEPRGAKALVAFKR